MGKSPSGGQFIAPSPARPATCLDFILPLRIRLIPLTKSLLVVDNSSIAAPALDRVLVDRGDGPIVREDGKNMHGTRCIMNLRYI